MGKERYVLDVNTSLINIETANLQRQVDALNEKENLYASISNEAGREISTIQEFEAFLRERTGFPNLTLAAQALELDKQYAKALELEQTEVAAKNKVEKKGGKYAAKAQVLDELRERNTSYIPEHLRPKFDALQQAVDMLNSLPPHARGCIRLNHVQEWKINAHRFCADS
jgi:hypothetical protein